jgi:hypothetical protein
VAGHRPFDSRWRRPALPACDAGAAVRVLVVEDELTPSLIRKGLREEGLPSG